MIVAINLLLKTLTNINNNNINSQTDALEINFLTYSKYALVKFTLSII